VAYTTGARRRPLRKKQYDQTLLSINSIDNDHCYEMADLRNREDTFLRIPRDTKMRNGVSVQSAPKIYKQELLLGRVTLCGAEIEYLHRIHASRKKRLKWNRVPGGITGPLCALGI
jgi:hypothetical protein